MYELQEVPAPLQLRDRARAMTTLQRGIRAGLLIELALTLLVLGCHYALTR